jgi:uncharacterized membrane protein (DUF2068 family)
MRPLGVTLIGFYQILRGVIDVLFGVSVIAFTNLAARMASLAAEGLGAGRFMHGLGHSVGFAILVFGVLHLAAGWGVLGMKNWGRLLTILFSAFGLFLLLPALAHGHVFSVAFGFINGASIIYLAMPPIKRAFHGQGNPMRASAY